MRRIKTLLKLLLKELEANGVDGSGLCWANYSLEMDGKINSDEEDLVHSYIEDNMPRCPGYPFYGWRPGLAEPRIKWLKKEIKKIS